MEALPLEIIAMAMVKRAAIRNIFMFMDLTHNIIEYVNCCIGAFANRFSLTLAQSYAYLRRFKGIDFLIDCYAAEHTLSIEDAVEDIMLLCQKNGGRLGC